MFPQWGNHLMMCLSECFTIKQHMTVLPKSSELQKQNLCPMGSGVGKYSRFQSVIPEVTEVATVPRCEKGHLSRVLCRSHPPLHPGQAFLHLPQPKSRKVHWTEWWPHVCCPIALGPCDLKMSTKPRHRSQE
jgi:hypothetical protein